MAKFNISDIGEAYDQAALLVDVNSPLFKEELDKLAEKQYRSRHFKEMNKTLSKRVKETRDWALNQGIKIGKQKYRIYGYCNICGEEYDILPKSDLHNAILKHLKNNKWSHSKCQQK